MHCIPNSQARYAMRTLPSYLTLKVVSKKTAKFWRRLKLQFGNCNFYYSGYYRNSLKMAEEITVNNSSSRLPVKVSGWP